MNLAIYILVASAAIVTSNLAAHGEDLYSLPHATVALYAVDTATGKVLIEKNSDLSMVPASCMKVITTGAALHILGEEYQFQTSLEYNGEISSEKILKGNIYIRGGGDPCLGSERITTGCSWNKQIELWVDAIEKLGIHKIEGAVIGDPSRWEKGCAVPSWCFEDLGNYYGAGASGLSFHENYYSIVFTPGAKIGESATLLRIEPPIPMLTIQNEVKTGPEGSGDCTCIYGSEYSCRQDIRGTIPLGVNQFTIKGAIPDPAYYCAYLLTAALQERGISVGKEEIVAANNRRIFHTTRSPSIREIVYWTNQKSINLYAEHLLKKMGEVVYKEGSTSAGIKAVTDFWRSQGVNLDGFTMVDGSGLSRKNLVTVKQFVEILQRMKTSNHCLSFFQSLPQKSPLIKAKSGSMSSIKGYVGYSENTTFAVIINNCSEYESMNRKLDECISSFK